MGAGEFWREERSPRPMLDIRRTVFPNDRFTCVAVPCVIVSCLDCCL